MSARTLYRHLRRLTCATAVVATVGLAGTPAYAVPTDRAYFHDLPVGLTNVTNVTVEGLPDASLVDTITSFWSDNPMWSCLNGETINVWTAPAEFPGKYVVHNGWQGPQCTYGTWTFPNPLSYTGVWSGGTKQLTHVVNETIEGLADASLVGTISNFQTNNTFYTCLNGSTINVWKAPAEYPGQYVVHNGWQGAQCAYGTWTFQGDVAAPSSSISTPNGALLISPLDHVNGVTTDDFSGTVSVTVTYSGLISSTVNAALSCNADRTWCAWSAALPLVPGSYTVRAKGTDAVGHVEASGPSISGVTVV